MNRFLRTGTAAAIALALAACAAIAPDRHGVAMDDVSLAQHASDIALANDAWPHVRWWTEYGDAQLDALVEQALRASPTLAVARSRIDAAGAALASDRSLSGLHAGLDAGVNRQRYSGNGLFPEPIGGNFYNDMSLQLKAGYDFDWWGKHRAQVAATLGELNARRAEQAQAERVLAASVAASYFRLQLLWARRANVQALLQIEQAVIADKVKRIAHGMARADEQRKAELELDKLNAQDAQLAADALREREGLRALCAGDATTMAQLQARTPGEAAHALPQKLGMELLARRPDLQAARYRVEATLGRVAASQAAFYPDINLVGAIGLDAVGLGRLLRPGSRTLFAGSAVELPLFDNGRLGALLDAERARRDEMIADYNELVFDAVREVAQEGATLQGMEKQIAQQRAAAGTSAAMLRGARRLQERGLADHAAVLQAQAAVLAQEDSRLQLLQQQRQVEIALIKALGGGYRAQSTDTAGTPVPLTTTKQATP
jgi:outer membrane protein, multidrug efflux system